jgi:cytochrome P450
VLYDPADPTFASRSQDIYRVLRDEHPVYADPGGRFYALSRFEDVRNACTDWETFSSVGKQESQFIKITMNSLDPPRHTAMRSLIARGFTPRRVADLEGAIRQIARDLIDGFRDTGRCDAIADYAAILPSVVMGRLIGLSDPDIALCRELTDEFMHQTQPDGQHGPAARSYEVFEALLEQRLSEPRDDLMSALLVAEINGVRLTQDELLGFGWLLLVGGNDTTTNLIGNGIELFARHPEQRRRLVDDPTLIADAVDEVLRIASPTHTLPRRTTRQATTPDGVIPVGSRVLLLWSAANLDDREFPEPERFDVTRRAPRHLALGHGVHYCMGASLAKLEARIAWEEWLAAMPEYTVTEPPLHFVSSTFYGWDALHVDPQFGPGSKPR